MWTLPGYGDHLEELDPGIRKQVAEVGGPTGFEDVVASINPIPDDQPDVPPHWSVTFAVDDADATAAKATELGGKVIVPPFDAPWVRMTVLTDPQGATFIASKFVPENRDSREADGRDDERRVADPPKPGEAGVPSGPPRPRGAISRYRLTRVKVGRRLHEASSPWSSPAPCWRPSPVLPRRPARRRSTETVFDETSR